MKLRYFLVILIIAIATYSFYDPFSAAEDKQFIVEDEIMEDIIISYEDDFTSKEKAQIKVWLKETTYATWNRLGKYPFQVHYFIYRSSGRGEPVPWANTERSDIQGVHFHIDPDFSIDAFLNDWTAPHEISHLALPFVGKSNSWFSEGFATFMQNEILMEMKEMDQSEVDDKFKRKLMNAEEYYDSDEPFAKVAQGLREIRRYPEMYWGGAYFFYELDQIYKSEIKTSLCDVLVQYQKCCRSNDKNINEIMRSFDQITRTKIASELMNDYCNSPARGKINVDKF